MEKFLNSIITKEGNFLNIRGKLSLDSFYMQEDNGILQIEKFTNFERWRPFL